jgi:ABC-type proline/glycine betaine transport system permease subunit
MTRVEDRASLIKLATLPAVVLLFEIAVFAYERNTHVDSSIQTIIEGNLLAAGELESSLRQHLYLVGVAFAITVAAGLPLAVLLFRTPPLVRVPVLALASLGQAVPSVAVLVYVSIWIGLGSWPTIIALVIYALLPVLRNTIVGLDGVDAAAVEAARGMGMTDLQILARVQLPLASPVIMAGLRTSLVLVVGTATLGTFVGGGGLGDIISEGIGASPSIGPRIVLVGAAMAAGLALLCDWLMSLLTRLVVPRT